MPWAYITVYTETVQGYMAEVTKFIQSFGIDCHHRSDILLSSAHEIFVRAKYSAGKLTALTEPQRRAAPTPTREDLLTQNKNGKTSHP